MDLLSCYESDDEGSHDLVEQGTDGAPDNKDSCISQKLPGAPSSRHSTKRNERSTASEPPQRPNKLIRQPRISIVSECDFVRAEPHVRGNWAGHVFIDTDCECLQNHATPCVERFRTILLERTNYQGNVLQHDKLHLSLSRPFYLQESNMESFVAGLRDRLEFETSFALQVHVQGQCLINDERTRSFWVWPVPATDNLLSLIQQVDDVLRLYNQPTYYVPPLFHISVASIPGAVTHPKRLCDDIMRHTLVLNVKSIKCTFGTTRTFTIPLT